MKHFVVASAYAIWLVLINVVFWLGQGTALSWQEYSVLAGVVPMGLQVLLLGFDPVGMMRPARMMGVFLIIVLLGYLFNGAGWSGVFYVVELLFLTVMSILVAGCPDRRLLPAMAEFYSVPTALWLLYIDFYGKYVWGRLVDGNLESNAWGLFGLSVGVAAFAHRSRIVGGFCLAVAGLTMYDASSRSSIVGLGAAAALIGIRYLGDLRNRRLIGAVAIIALFLAFAIVAVPAVRDSVSDFFVNLMKLDDPNRGLGSGSTGRDVYWRAALDLWWSHPWFGVGFLMHQLYMPLNYEAHNAFIAMLADTGIFGLLWYIALLVLAWSGMFRVQESRMRYLAIALVSSYTFIGLFERRAINGGNPMSIMFLMAVMVIFREATVARAHRVIARGRQAWSLQPVLRAGGGGAR